MVRSFDIASCGIRRRWPVASSNDGDEAQLGQRCDPVVQALLFDNPSVFETQYRRPGEMHLPARSRWESADEKVVESRPGMRATAFPTTDNVVALGNQVGSAPE